MHLFFCNVRIFLYNNVFLVPGYGAQGGNAKDIINCFNEDGLGAIVSSSRGILYSYMNENNNCTKEEYKIEYENLIDFLDENIGE